MTSHQLLLLAAGFVVGVTIGGIIVFLAVRYALHRLLDEPQASKGES